MQKLINTIITHIIPHHTQFNRFTSKHTGKSITLIVESQTYTWLVHQSGLIAIENLQSDAILTMNTEAILGAIGIKHPGANISLQGDHQLGTAFSQLFNLKRINTTDLLQTILPEKTALVCNELLYYFKKQQSYTMNMCIEQLRHYLIDEKGFCVDQKDADQQYESILDLKWAIEKLKSS